MKTLTFIVCLLTASLGASANEVNEQVLKAFAASFPEAKNVAWEELKEGYKVFFVKNEVSYRLRYDEEGNVVLALKYYREDNLPPLIANKVKKSYRDYKIHSVVEESSETSLMYHIILENDKKIINLKSDPVGSLEVESKYNKS
ncbi:PepSY-like domain-containing protein [Sediminibacterium soli]|uniref:PepSY-like domain-containing protein n=1 Tax=Sediminibacterium soli TaxID=2698829 RepID=UPI00137A6A7A|nr:PepSY-like domain-containing protein [Sediminibacterium soli]NCI47398.1 hypothetical protein [Sediminibacterium soli]